MLVELVNESANRFSVLLANSPIFAGIIQQLASVSVTLNTQIIKLYSVYCFARQKQE